MLKSLIIIQFMLICVVRQNHGKLEELEEPSSTPTVDFIKPKPNIMRRLNPLKVLFTVAHIPETSSYSVEWNLPLLKTMLLESEHVTDEDKALFITQFSDQIDDYANWSEEKRYALERFTEKYFNLYKSPDVFLPFIDCTALTYALMDEMISGFRIAVDEQKRAKFRSQAVERLCNSK